MGEHEVARCRAVFLDRDGVIVRATVREGKPYPPATLDELELTEDASQACQLLKQAGFLLVVATNQPDVGRGAQSRTIVEQMHAHLAAQLPIDSIEVCYDAGNAPSEFRKPAPGMLLRASSELGIDLKRSFMVGDRWRDIDCGYVAGCTTIFIDRGYCESLRQPPDYRVSSLLEAANIILESER
jgi:D-glycero-D-manno-heptose 1,7-bisphosphate phosphatase